MEKWRIVVERIQSDKIDANTAFRVLGIPLLTLMKDDYSNFVAKNNSY